MDRRDQAARSRECFDRGIAFCSFFLFDRPNARQFVVEDYAVFPALEAFIDVAKECVQGRQSEESEIELQSNNFPIGTYHRCGRTSRLSRDRAKSVKSGGERPQQDQPCDSRTE